MNVIAFRGATLAVDGRAVLRDASFEVGVGEFIGVLGPNGAGKTTLMRAILGLLKPVSGTIEVLSATPRRGHAGIGYMPQVRSLPAQRLSGFDSVAAVLGGQRWGLPLVGRAARAEVGRVLALVGATDLAARPLAELSGGERQRLMFAQALLGRPALLLLDEPLISLDPKHQGGIVDLVKSVQREIGVTVLFSAHDLNPLLGALDRVLYLGGGQVALGPVTEVITPPVLSRLYGAPMDVIQAGRRLFVVAGQSDA